MERPYKDRVANDITYFTGFEVENTAAYGKLTLFVVGLHSFEEIMNVLHNYYAHDGVHHIYLGANKSFNQDEGWRHVVDALLHEGFWVTLDYPLRLHNFVMRQFNQEMRHSRFIPMISVEIPNIESYNYNTVLKIDDISMDHSNPGVWCHPLHDLMDRKVFTPWSDYESDEVIDNGKDT
jgi:hypothetical protein